MVPIDLFPFLWFVGSAQRLKTWSKLKCQGKPTSIYSISSTSHFAVCPVVAELKKLRTEIYKTKILYWTHRVCMGGFNSFEVDSPFLPTHFVATT